MPDQVDRLPGDIAARRQALDPALSFIVQAPAGSGKTGLLVRRYLTLLATVQSPEEILAITFTRKATAEMRLRILRALQGRDEHNQPEQDQQMIELGAAVRKNDQQHGWELLINTRRLRIQTIDSFCSELVQRMPWSARFGAAPSIIEDASQLYLRAAQLTLDHIEDRHNPERANACSRLLEMIDANLQRAREMLAEMLSGRDKWMGHLQHYNRERLETWWQLTINQQLVACHDLLGREMRDEIAALAKIAATNLSGRESPSAPQAEILNCIDLQGFPEPQYQFTHQWRSIATMLLTKERAVRKRVDKNCGFPPEQKPALNRIKKVLAALQDDTELGIQLTRTAQLPDGQFSELQWLDLEALLILLPVAAAELRLLFRETNQADYIELGQRAGAALGEVDSPSDLTLAFDYHLKHLLMDEFQDTSGGQINLLEKLIAGWQPGDGRSVFLVGDPMQSIYRFREAEVGNFLNTQESGIGQVLPEPLLLQSNFRSDPILVDWFNQTFRQVMPSHSDFIRSSVRYSPAIAHRNPEIDSQVRIHPFIDRSAAEEAGDIVDLIQNHLEGFPQQSIAVLGRTRSSLNPVAKSLTNRRIHFQAKNLQKLRDRQSIQDLLVLARALMQPADRGAWVSLLRTPWCGMALDDITALCEADKSLPLFAIWEDSAGTEGMSKDGQQRLANLRNILRQGMRNRGRISLARNLEATWLRLGGPSAIDPVDLPDCKRFMDLIRQLEHDSTTLTADAIDSAIEQLWSSGEPSATVQLLTIHGAKGLQFDTVVLPNLDRQPRSMAKELLRFKNFPDRLLMAPRPSSSEGNDRFFDYLKELEKEHQHNESTRLLYVACTRARKNLHIFASANIDNKGALRSPRAGSLLALLWPVMETEFQDKLNEPTSPSSQIVGRGQSFDYPMIRLPLEWKPPLIAESVETRSTQVIVAPELSQIEFSWTGEVSRICGIVIHQILQQIDQVGWNIWRERPIDRKTRSLWYRRLIERGVPAESLNNALIQVIEAVESARQDPNAPWIFSATHHEIKTEWPVSGVINSQLVHAVIDRSFIDQENIRWIIDFKSSRHQDQDDLERFMQQERQRYSDKMEMYVNLVGALGPGEIRSALYYPLLRRFEEL